MVREGWGMWRPTLINPGSLFGLRTGADCPRDGPTTPSGQRVSCPLSPYRQVLKPAAPAQAASQGLAPYFLSHSPCQTAVFWSPQAEHPDPILLHLWPAQGKYPSCLGPMRLHFLLLQMGK